MRLRAIHCFTAERDPNANATEWFETTVKPFCQLYLTENTLNPYATVRHWMHLFTAEAPRTPRPYRIQWKSQRVMLFDGKEVDIDRYFAFVRQELQDLEEFVQKEVLFGISLAELKIECDPVELRMASTGGPLLTGDCAIGLDNPQSNRFASALFAGSYLGPEGQHGGNSIQIDPTKGVHWVNKIGNTMQRLHPISHVTQGLPGRGSEESLLSQSNIDVELEHRTLGFQASHLKTNLFKHIFRMLAPRVSKLLYIMKCEQTLQMYRNRVFVYGGHAMPSHLLSTNLGNWSDTEGAIGFHMGFRGYRQFASALNYKYLGGLAETPEASAGDHRAGRSREVGEKNYGVQRWKADAGLARRMCVEKSLGWQKMMGL
ncbi:hypothetical protein B0H14DRAFT_1278782 [Mycena olivaceomarginata]|nr:hypothetical protein B0H14DRAFT_1278782 [Mycena olivaceomarginata]